METTGSPFFQFDIITNVLVGFSRFNLNTYIMGVLVKLS